MSSGASSCLALPIRFLEEGRVGVRARECTAQSRRALPCFIFWAGPGLIPHLPRGLSGAHTEGDGPCCTGEGSREALSTRPGKG